VRYDGVRVDGKQLPSVRAHHDSLHAVKKYDQDAGQTLWAEYPCPNGYDGTGWTLDWASWAQWVNGQADALAVARQAAKDRFAELVRQAATGTPGMTSANEASLRGQLTREHPALAALANGGAATPDALKEMFPQHAYAKHAGNGEPHTVHRYVR